MCAAALEFLARHGSADDAGVGEEQPPVRTQDLGHPFEQRPAVAQEQHHVERHHGVKRVAPDWEREVEVGLRKANQAHGVSPVPRAARLAAPRSSVTP